MPPHGSPCFQDTETESSNFRPMEGTGVAHVEERFAMDYVCHAEPPCAESSSWEQTMEIIPQLRQAMAVIENVCRISSTLWRVKTHQSKQMAISFRAVGEALKGLRWDRSLVRSELSDALDKLLAVLRKGESLVSYYNTWFGGISVWRNNGREARFKEVHEELDMSWKALFQFGGFTDVGQEQDLKLTSGSGSCMRTMIQESEMPEEMTCDQVEQITGIGMHMLGLEILRQVEEAKDARDMIGERSYLAEVCTATWTGVPLVVRILGTFSLTWVLQLEFDVINKLNHHLFLQDFYDESGSIMMDHCMQSDINLEELIGSQRWRTVPILKGCITVPFNFHCEVLDILLQAGMGMAYLHSGGVIHRDRKSINILVYKHPCKRSLSTCSWRAPKILPPKIPHCYEVLTGAQSKILNGEEQEKFPKHIFDGRWRETGDSNSYLQKEPPLSEVFLNSTDDLVHSGSQREALEVSAFINEGGGNEASKFDKDNEAQPNDQVLPTTSTNIKSSTNVVSSCTPEATLHSQTLVQQGSTEILSGFQVPQIRNHGEPPRNRNCTRIWSDDERLALLELTEEALELDVGRPDWDYVSEYLLEHYGFDRASISCQQQWSTLRQFYRANQDHESNISGAASGEFDLKCKEILDRILAANLLDQETIIFQTDVDLAPSAPRRYGFQSSALYPDHFGSANNEEALEYESTDEESEETDIETEDKELSGGSTETLDSQAEVTANSDDSDDANHGDKTKLDMLQLNQEYSEDDLISRITPFVNKQVEDALKSLDSVIFALQRQEENAQKQQQEMLAIEEELLSLKREKMLFTRRALEPASPCPPKKFHSKTGLG